MGRNGRCRGGLPADGDSAALRARIAVGSHQGQKAVTLQTGPARAEAERDAGRLVNAADFSLHCGVAATAHQRAKLERLCRFIHDSRRRPNGCLPMNPRLDAKDRYWPKADPKNTGFRAVETSAFGKSGHSAWDMPNWVAEWPLCARKRTFG